MTPLKHRIFAVIAAAALGGCSFASDALFPSLSDNETATPEVQAVQIAPSAAETSETPTTPPEMGSTVFEPLSVTPGPETGTFVGRKVVTFRNELSQLQRTIRRRNQSLQSIRSKAAEDARRYHEIVAFVNARLQVGTTPGNPVMHEKWRQAQHQLGLMNNDVAMMNQLATQVASDSAMTAYLLDSIRAAYNVSGAVDEDHKQLRILEDETNQTSVLIERLLNELNHDIARQQQYIDNEKDNLNTLALAIKDGQLFGSSFSSSAAPASTQEISGSAAGSAPLPQANVSGRRPLVKIRFDRANVPYEQALYQAVKRALERQPNVEFDLVAVTPAGALKERSHTSRRHAEAVLRTLNSMGLPISRVRMAGMTSPQAHSSEVHLYVR